MPDFEDSCELTHRIIIARRDERRDLKADAFVRSNHQTRVGGSVVDVSENGCRIELCSGSVRAGQHVTVKISGLEAWSGVVRWAEKFQVGVEFTRPLHPAVVDHLGRTLPAVELV